MPKPYHISYQPAVLEQMSHLSEAERAEVLAAIERLSRNPYTASLVGFHPARWLWNKWMWLKRELELRFG